MEDAASPANPAGSSARTGAKVRPGPNEHEAQPPSAAPVSGDAPLDFAGHGVTRVPLDPGALAATSTTTAGGPLGATLEPIVRRACDGRLSGVTWFRTDWQRGGAATGYAAFRPDGEPPRDVVVKLPVPPRERQWLIRLQPHDGLAPRVYAHGEALNGYDLAWVVMERLPHGPLTSAWRGLEFDLVVDAVGKFYAAAADVPLVGTRPRRDWHRLFERARRHVAGHALPEYHRWKNALKKAHRKLDAWVDAWESRPIDGWCHGDLHLANAMTRTPAPEGPAVLLDFAEVEPGHGLEDAVYFEHLYWAARDRLAGRKLTRAVARRRRELGLPVEPDWAELAHVKRALLAATTPALLDAEGDPAHVDAALSVLERSVE